MTANVASVDAILKKRHAQNGIEDREEGTDHV